MRAVVASFTRLVVSKLISLFFNLLKSLRFSQKSQNSQSNDIEILQSSFSGSRQYFTSQIFLPFLLHQNKLHLFVKVKAVMKLQFTKISIKELVCSQGKAREFYRDTNCRGLKVEVRSTGGKTYYLSYNDHRCKQRLLRLANALDITPTQARQLCDRARAQIAMGHDPADQQQQRRNSPSLAQFFNESYLPYIQSYKRSWQTDVSVFKNHVLPHLGELYMDSIKTKDIGAVMSRAKLHLCNGSSNKILILLRYMFNLAIRWQTVGAAENPTATLKLSKVTAHRERFLSADETQHLLEAVNHSANSKLKFIIPMLLLTGARKREVLDAKWRDIDKDRLFWRIPVTKSGKERHVPLSAAALDLLEKVPRSRFSDYIFENPQTHQSFSSIFFSWDTARIRAGLKDVRIHDLRHSFASFLVNAGCSLYEVQKILGHASINMTQRYSHLNQESLLRAVSHAGHIVAPSQNHKFASSNTSIVPSGQM